MIISIDVEPGVATIYHAEAELRGTTALELMAAVLAFWPAVQWDMKQEVLPAVATENPPFGSGY